MKGPFQTKKAKNKVERNTKRKLALQNAQTYEQCDIKGALEVNVARAGAKEFDQKRITKLNIIAITPFVSLGTDKFRHLQQNMNHFVTTCLPKAVDQERKSINHIVDGYV